MSDLPTVELPLPGTQPEYHYPPYVSTIARSPRQPLLPLPLTRTETTGPVFRPNLLRVGDSDLTAQHAAPPLGERIYVHGRVLDEDGRPVRNALVEIWQANSAGRYRHKVDTYNAPLDPNFTGEGRTLTDDNGYYCFKTIKPGPYPWGNHHNAWRPSHIHFSLFGAGILSRLVTQMYFPGDPLQPLDPIFNSIPDPDARQRLVSKLDMQRAEDSYALAYAFDIVLRGSHDTPFEENHR
ncbi:protocatechuate 3,4-dioxygenase subunit beta [Acidobacteria bacterium AB60]|nr:protocatechuate 3,4-dioxygenase subunit beta [Acidobacteria bacterium AB60]